MDGKDSEENRKRIIHLVHPLYFQKNISYPLISTRTCVSGVRNISISVNFAYALKEWYHRASTSPTVPWLVSIIGRKLVGLGLRTHIRNIFLAYNYKCLKFRILEIRTGLINESKNLPGACIEPSQTFTNGLICKNS